MIEKWEEVTLGSVCEKTTNIKWKKHIGVNFKYIDLSSVSRVTLKITSDSIINHENAPSRAKKIIKTDDVIFATTRPTLKRVTIINDKYNNQICSTGFVILRPNKLKIKSIYISYFIQSNKFMDRMQILQRGASYPAVTDKDVKSTIISIPPLAEQQKIVAILDSAFEKIDKAIANIEQNIANAKELFQSKLNEIFSQRGDGWEEKKLGEICNVLNGYAFKSKDTIINSNTQLLRMGNLYQNKLDLKRKPVFYPEKFAKLYERYLLNEDDLIMSLTGTVDKTDYGYTVKISKISKKLLLNQRIMKIDIKEGVKLNKDYLKHYLRSPDFLKRLYATASGTRQANLSSKTIMMLNINFPSAEEKQVKITKQLNFTNKNSEKLQKIYKQKLTNLKELKKSLLEKAFKGELST